jgi:hypothetical protein
MGYPYNITQADDTGWYNGAQYITEIGNPHIARSQRTVTNWFNINAFMTTPPDSLGNAPRATLFGPGQNVWNMSVIREIPFGERATFSFRADVGNVFNHPQFDNLSTSSIGAALPGATNVTAGSTFGHVTGSEDARGVLVDGRIRF